MIIKVKKIRKENMLSRAPQLLKHSSRSLLMLSGAVFTGITLQRHYGYQPRSTLPIMTLMPAQLAYCEEAVQQRRVYIGLSVRSMMDQPGMMVLLVNTESPAW